MRKVNGNLFSKVRIPYNKGLPLSLETRQKISNSKKGSISNFKGKKHSEESKKKMSLRRVGLKLSDTTKKNMSIASTKRYDRVGRRKYKRYLHVTDKKYLKWRSDVFRRDNWTCQTCNIRGVYLEAHHIKSWAKYPEFRYDLENGVALCKECHKLTDNYKNKKHV